MPLFTLAPASAIPAENAAPLAATAAPVAATPALADAALAAAALEAAAPDAETALPAAALETFAALALVAAFFTATVLAAAPDAEILAALALAVFFAAVPATAFAPGVPTAVLDAVTFAEPATCDDKDDSFEALAVVAALEVWVAAILVDAMVTQACACSALSAITSSIALRGAILFGNNRSDSWILFKKRGFEA